MEISVLWTKSNFIPKKPSCMLIDELISKDNHKKYERKKNEKDKST